MGNLNKKKNEVEPVANCDHLQSLKFRPTLPYAYTEQGIGQLSTVVLCVGCMDLCVNYRFRQNLY